jgi:DNA-binding CsgD family transcriptional regulator
MATAVRRLVGREQELATVVELLDAPVDAPDVAVLAGEAGIGKTTVWLAAQDEAAERGYRVMSTRPGESETGWSYAGLSDLLHEAAPDLLPHLPAVQRRALESALLLGEPDRAVDERTVAAATLSALRTAAQEQPVLMAVDDLQWLDAATTAALRFALPRLVDEPVRAVLAVRGSAPDWLRRSVGDERLRVVDVGTLSLGATHELLRLRLDARLSRPTLIRIWETSRGNPFFALELAAALQRRGGTLAAGEDLPIPTSLDALLRERLDGLGAPALELAQVVAALAEPTVGLAESVVGEFETGLGEALAARILEVDGERLRFDHPLLGPAVLERQTPSQRRALHARLAEVATTTEQRARHLGLATRDPSSEIAATLEDAAREAHARGALAAAAELAERALALTPATDRADAHQRVLFTAHRHHLAGDLVRARALLEHARGEATPGRERAAILAQLADVVSEATGSERDGEALCRAALPEAEGDAVLEARIHTDLAEYLGRSTGLEHAVGHAAKAVDAASRSGDVALLCSARAVLASHRLWAGEGLQRAELEDAVALERTLPDWPIESGPSEYLSLELVWTAAPEDARALILELRDAHRNRDPAAEAWDLRNLGIVEWRAGKWDEAERHAVESAALRAQVGVNRREKIPSAALAAHLGRVDEALDLARTRHVSAVQDFAWGEWTLGFVELSLGDADAAVGHLRRSHELLDRVILEPAMRVELGDLLEALVAVGELDEAEGVILAWERPAAAHDRAWALAILARCRGLLLAARGDLDGASAHFERALAEHARVTDPFQHARTLLALGRTRRRAKRRAAARETLTDALARFDRLGAPLWAEQTRAELARIGGRTRAEGLTPAERRVAELVAAGRTNAEVAATLFLAERTVASHLTHVYAKLGVRSRTELAARTAPP